MRVLDAEEKIKAIEYLKFRLLETKWPFFSDQQLDLLIELNLNDRNLALHEGLLLKSREDKVKLPGGLEKPSNRAYWLEMYRNVGAAIANAIEAGAYDDILEAMRDRGIIGRYLKVTKNQTRSLTRADGQ